LLALLAYAAMVLPHLPDAINPVFSLNILFATQYRKQI
jgi:hypothetical protein